MHVPTYFADEMLWMFHSFSASGKDFIWQRHTTTAIGGSSQRPNNLGAKVSSNLRETADGRVEGERDNLAAA